MPADTPSQERDTPESVVGLAGWFDRRREGYGYSGVFGPAADMLHRYADALARPAAAEGARERAEAALREMLDADDAWRFPAEAGEDVGPAIARCINAVHQARAALRSLAPDARGSEPAEEANRD